MTYSNPLAMPVARLQSYHIGNIVTIIEKDEDGSWVETTSILSSVQRVYDAETALIRMKIRLGGNDADTRNGMLFVVDADEADDYSTLFTVTVTR